MIEKAAVGPHPQEANSPRQRVPVVPILAPGNHGRRHPPATSYKLAATNPPASSSPRLVSPFHISLIPNVFHAVFGLQIISAQMVILN